MTITLYYNASEKNKVTKTLTQKQSYSGTLKAETSVLDPVIIFEADLDDITECNYMSITEFGRSYFINDIRSLRNGIVEVSAHVDVLSSFKDELLLNKAIIHKQEQKWNLYLNDGSFKMYQNPNVVTKEFPQGFSAREYVLVVAGRDSTP